MFEWISTIFEWQKFIDHSANFVEKRCNASNHYLFSYILVLHIHFILKTTTHFPLFFLDHLVVFKCVGEKSWEYCWYFTMQDGWIGCLSLVTHYCSTGVWIKKVWGTTAVNDKTEVCNFSLKDKWLSKMLVWQDKQMD